MQKGSAYLVVGHSDWGKSTVLRAITSGLSRQRTAQIAGRTFYVRKTSNDDWPNDQRMWKWVKKLDAEDKPLLLLALCPDFDDSKKHTADILSSLRKTHALRFFVLKYAYGSGEQITKKQIKALRRYGRMHFHLPRNQPAAKIAAALKGYVVKTI